MYLDVETFIPAALAAAMLLALAGCAPVPVVFVPADEEPQYEVFAVAASPSSSPAAASGTVPDGGLDSSAATTSAGDSVDFAGLSWSYGGFKGGSAVIRPGCEIADLRVSDKGLTYKWARGGCESLGAADRGDHSRTLACLFVRGADGAWRGGKFDWISTSRTTRSFENIRSGYGGWPKDAIETATGYAFVIVSADGRRRTNVITAGR